MNKTAVDILIHKIHQELEWFYPKVKLSPKLIDEIKAIEKEQLKMAYNEDRPYLSGYETGQFFEEHYKNNYEQGK